MPDPFKRRRVDGTPGGNAAGAALLLAKELPSSSANVIAQLVSLDGTSTGPQLDLPSDVTPGQLGELLNGLLRNEERTPYAFYCAGSELHSELGPHLHKAQASVEGVLQITYQPQALFRVAPVSRCSSALAGHSEAVLAVSFSPDGKHLATGSGDTTVRFYDLARETPAQPCAGHKNWVLCVAWSPDAALLASGGMDGEVRLWQPGSGNVSVALLKGHKKGITALVRTTSDVTELRFVSRGPLPGQAWEPAHRAMPCRRLASSSRDGTVRIWDATLRRCLLSLTSHGNVVTSVKWGGDGLLYSASRDTLIHVWEPLEGKLVRTLKGHGHWVNTLALSSEYALRTGAFDHRGGAPVDAPAAQAQALKRWSDATGGAAERLVSGSDDFTMFLWTPATSKVPTARMTGHVQLINHVCFSPDGSKIASASFDKCCKLWDGFTGAFLCSLRAHVGPVYQLAWSADSRMLVSSSRDATLKLWEAATGSMKLDLPGHEDEVFAVDWAPSGGRVASGGKDTQTRIWRQ